MGFSILLFFLSCVTASILEVTGVDEGSKGFNKGVGVIIVGMVDVGIGTL